MNFFISPEISHYEIVLNHFSFQLQMQGRFELKTQFKFTPQTLFANFSFPAQFIENVELIPVYGENCKSTKSPCQVFKTNSYIKLLSDRYFSREFSKYEKVPLNIDFEFKTTNWSTFHSKNKSNFFYPSDQADLVNKIKLLKIKNEFPYKNAFYLTRYKYESTYKSIDIPVSWTLSKDKKTQVNTKRVTFNFAANDDLQNPISKWFSVYENKNLDISIHESSYSGQSINLLKTTENNLINFHTHPMISSVSQGFLEAKLALNLDNSNVQVNIKNQFSFKRKKLPLNRKIRIKVQNKRDYFFKKRHLFKYIDF